MFDRREAAEFCKWPIAAMRIDAGCCREGGNHTLVGGWQQTAALKQPLRTLHRA